MTNAPTRKDADRLILTVGHSTRSIDEFIGLLHAHGVTKLVDVRTVPRSRHNPQFGQERLPASLKAAGIAYEHQPALGGLRRTSEQSPNKGWRNLSFRGYADHMQSPEFHQAVEDLIRQAARGERLVLMCAEAVPWRCHRSLIADALLVRGVACADIRTTTQRMPHRLTPFAKVHGTEITYPSDDRPAAGERSPPTKRRGSTQTKKPSRPAGASKPPAARVGRRTKRPAPRGGRRRGAGAASCHSVATRARG